MRPGYVCQSVVSSVRPSQARTSTGVSAGPQPLMTTWLMAKYGWSRSASAARPCAAQTAPQTASRASAATAVQRVALDHRGHARPRDPVVGRWSFVVGPRPTPRARRSMGRGPPTTNDQRPTTGGKQGGAASFAAPPIADQLDLRHQADRARLPDGVGDLVHQPLDVGGGGVAEVDDEVGVRARRSSRRRRAGPSGRPPRSGVRRSRRADS